MNTEKTVFTITDIPEGKRNGYGMPWIEVKSSTELDVYNRGWNEFECKQDIDISGLAELDEKFPNASHLYLEISTPTKRTNAWYYIKSHHPEAKYKLQW